MPTTEWLNKYEAIKDKLTCKDDLEAHFTEKVIGNMAVDVLDIGVVHFPTGQIFACDPLVELEDTLPFLQTIPAGTYPVKICVVPSEQYGDRYACVKVEKPGKERRGCVAVCTGGTADIPVAEEAAQTAEYFGCRVDRIFDVGVAGIHRLLAQRERLDKASCIVAVAGMEGALGTVIAGLVECPVVAVPTSVGYGASFHGLSALLTMLNSCANGISVVNIDNGYGAGYLAAQINRMAVR